MKAILYINWGLLAIYACICIYGLLDTSGMDAAGRGMSMGFSMIGLMLIVILALLNLIPQTWLRIVILLINLYPIFSSIQQALHRHRYTSLHKAGKQHVSTFDDPHLKLLVEAIDNINDSTLAELLQQDASQLNQMNSSGQTLLGIAVWNEVVHKSPASFRIVKLLLTHGADPNVHGPNRSHPLATVSLRSSIGLFELLLRHGADPNGKDENGEAVIYHLVRDYHGDHMAKLKLMLESYHADPNISFGDEGWTLNYSALLFAASSKQWDICHLLLAHGADVHFEPPSGYDLWMYLDVAEQAYKEAEEIPANFQSLLELPIIQSNRNK